MPVGFRWNVDGPVVKVMGSGKSQPLVTAELHLIAIVVAVAS